MKVLLIDDDVKLADALVQVLANYGIELAHAETPSAGLQRLQAENFDVLLLDMMLPEMDGLTVCRKIRSGDGPARDIPIIAFTARAGLVERVAGLESGFDDYIAKPVEPRVLVARIGSVSRRMRGPRDTGEVETPVQSNGRIEMVSQGKALTLDTERNSFSHDGIVVQMTPQEASVMSELIQANGEVVDRKTILNRIGHGGIGDQSHVDVVIYRIRQKVRAAGLKAQFIQTVGGIGYRIANGGQAK